MTTPQSLTGRCICGACTLTIADAPSTVAKGVHVCHCLDCRRNTGSLAGVFLMPPTPNLQVNGSPKAYQHQGTGSLVTRHFCADCGTPLYGIVGRFPDVRYVHGGIFPPGSLPAPHSEIWRQNAEHWEKAYPDVALLMDTQPPVEPSAA